MWHQEQENGVFFKTWYIHSKADAWRTNQYWCLFQGPTYHQYAVTVSETAELCVMIMVHRWVCEMLFLIAQLMKWAPCLLDTSTGGLLSSYCIPLYMSLLVNHPVTLLVHPVVLACGFSPSHNSPAKSYHEVICLIKIQEYISHWNRCMPFVRKNSSVSPPPPPHPPAFHTPHPPSLSKLYSSYKFVCFFCGFFILKTVVSLF